MAYVQHKGCTIKCLGFYKVLATTLVQDGFTGSSIEVCQFTWSHSRWNGFSFSFFTRFSSPGLSWSLDALACKHNSHCICYYDCKKWRYAEYNAINPLTGGTLGYIAHRMRAQRHMAHLDCSDSQNFPRAFSNQRHHLASMLMCKISVHKLYNGRTQWKSSYHGREWHAS